MFEKLEFWNFIVRKSVVTGIGNRKRVVTIALLTADGGRRTNTEVEALINEGIRNIKMNDTERENK